MSVVQSDQSIDLDVRNVVKRFGDFVAVGDTSFSVPNGSFFSFLGPSGCGKTTLLRMVAGFLEPDAGEILIKGESMVGVPPNKRPVNMVFQHLALFPMMNVAKNIGYGLRRRGVARAEIDRRVDAMLERIGLPDAGGRRIEQLSGGQKQRIAIARCLVLEPTLLLLDEPLGALDLKLREHMKVELKRLQAQVGTTFIYITHDQSEALVMSDQVAVMNHGRFEQVGSPQELYYRPETPFVAGFVGDSNRWRGRVDSLNGGEARVVTADGMTLIARITGEGIREQGPVEVFVRPESVVFGRDPGIVGEVPNRLGGTVENVLFNGADSRVLVAPSGGGETIIVALPQTGQFADLADGDEVHLGWSAEKAICFAAAADG